MNIVADAADEDRNMDEASRGDRWAGGGCIDTCVRVPVYTG